MSDSTNTQTGAVVNQGGVLTLIDTTIRDNISTGATAGLYNYGLTQLVAKDANTVISGNIINAQVTENADGTLSYVAGTGSKHSITNNTNDLYLNAAAGRKVVIDDAVTGDSGGININSTGTYSTASLDADGNIVYTSHDLPTAGTIEFNSDVTQSGLILNAGTLHVTKDNALHIGNVTVNSGILDLTTNDTENQSLGSLTLGGAMGLKIDASLSGTLADVIGANSLSASGNKINLNTVNLTSGMTNQYKKIYISDSLLKDAITGSGSSVYDAVSYGWQVKNDDSTGAYILVKNSDFHNFITSVRYDDDTFYNLTDDIDVAQQLADLGDTPDDKTRIGAIRSDKTSYTINGATHNIIGGNKGGIEVGTTQTLTINNVGDMYGFSGNAVTNAGTLNISDTKVSTIQIL